MDPHKDHKAIVDHGIPFCSREGQAFIRLPLFAGGCYGFAIRSLDFRNWFFSEFHNRYDHLPTESEFRAIMTHLEAQASSDPLRKRAVFRRVGSRSHPTTCRTIDVYLDLSNQEGRYVHITADDWKIVAADKVDFLIARSSIDLPEPRGPGALDKLRPPHQSSHRRRLAARPSVAPRRAPRRSPHSHPHHSRRGRFRQDHGDAPPAHID